MSLFVIGVILWGIRHFEVFDLCKQIVEPCHATVISDVEHLGFAAREVAEILRGVDELFGQDRAADAGDLAVASATLKQQSSQISSARIVFHGGKACIISAPICKAASSYAEHERFAKHPPPLISMFGNDCRPLSAVTFFENSSQSRV
jgi:hypothetical protein